jgi:hypothetical protein
MIMDRIDVKIGRAGYWDRSAFEAAYHSRLPSQSLAEIARQRMPVLRHRRIPRTMVTFQDGSLV